MCQGTASITCTYVYISHMIDDLGNVFWVYSRFAQCLLWKSRVQYSTDVCKCWLEVALISVGNPLHQRSLHVMCMCMHAFILSLPHSLSPSLCLSLSLSLSFFSLSLSQVHLSINSSLTRSYRNDDCTHDMCNSLTSSVTSSLGNSYRSKSNLTRRPVRRKPDMHCNYYSLSLSLSFSPPSLSLPPSEL